MRDDPPPLLSKVPPPADPKAATHLPVFCLVFPGGHLTLGDLRNYSVEVVSPVVAALRGYTLYSAPRPAAGPILSFILKVLEGKLLE